MKEACSVDGCDRAEYAKGLCSAHYKRQRATGDPLGMRTQFSKWHPGMPAERFWAKVNKNGPVPDHAPLLGPCWVWTGATIRGYGAFTVDGEQGRAHHFLVGSPLHGLHWDHLCRVHACVRPEHLELVTPRVNTLRGIGPSAINAEKSHCIHGHLLGEPQWNGKRWRRHCLECDRRKSREYQKRRRGHTATALSVTT